MTVQAIIERGTAERCAFCRCTELKLWRDPKLGATKVYCAECFSVRVRTWNMVGDADWMKVVSEDRTSSASRQHYIDTGSYLTEHESDA